MTCFPFVPVPSLCGIGAVLLALFASLGPEVDADDQLHVLRKLVVEHCLACHGEDDNIEADVDLRVLNSTVSIEAHADLLLRVRKAVSDLVMPPERDTLPDHVRSRMTESVQDVLSGILATHPFEPIPIRRMNRFQYNNAVVDLLDLDRDIFQLNERLLRRREDYFQPQTGKMPEQVRVSSRPLSKDIDNQRPEGFRGVAAFPQDKRAEHGFDNRADHLTMSPLLMEAFLQLSQTVAWSPDLRAEECDVWDQLFAPPGGLSRGEAEGRLEAEPGGAIRVVAAPVGNLMGQNMTAWGSHWSGDHQLIWQCRAPNLELQLEFDLEVSGTGLVFGFTRAPDYGTYEIWLDGVPIGKRQDLYHVGVNRADDVKIEKLNVQSGRHRLTFKCVGKNNLSTSYQLGVDYVQLIGRRPEPARRDTPAVSTVLQQRIEWLLRRAFRRDIDAATAAPFVELAEDVLAKGDSLEDAMRNVVAAVLGMPEFFYLYEMQTASDAASRNRQRITNFELANRLSQFFWSSIPDDELLDLASNGRLADPKVLETQIDRMLNDRRSSRFCDNFPGQWLQLERLVTSIPDRQQFPYFYYHGYRTSMHMMSEPLLLFETVFVENRSVMDLIAPDFTWQSDMLLQNYSGRANARHDVQVQTFKRVALDDQRRGGVITNAAVMTMTSTPVRTQPITRGAWINEVIFNDPPEPPPADVPPLPEVDQAELAKLTIRERLAVHRQRSDCAGCHNQIDPLGFALENFGPTGVWRDTYSNGRKVDSTGVLFNRSSFRNVVEFKKLIVQERTRFLRGFISHLMSYGLGRQLGPADVPAIDRMTAAAGTGDDRLREVLKRIAMSEPFLHKNGSAQTQ